MNLVPYIVSSILLSGIGWGVYLLFRWVRPEAKGRRTMAWLVLLTSLTIPLAYQINPAGTYSHESEAFAQHQSSVGLVPPAGQTLNEFCHCAEPIARDVVLYQASRVYDTLLVNGPWIAGLLLCITLGFLFLHALRIARLVRWVKQFPAEMMELNGRRIHLVRGKVAVGALRLGRKYIFWNPELDQLPTADRQAILMHELSHLRQHNTFEKIFLAALQGIWFANPVFYFFRKELDHLSEYVADAYAAEHSQGRKHYARLLLAIKSQPQFYLGSFFKGASLKGRIEYLLQKSGTARLPLWPAIVLGLGILFSGDVFAQRAIQENIEKIAVYEFMQAVHQQTGQEEFCYKCTLEAVECQ